MPVVDYRLTALQSGTAVEPTDESIKETEAEKDGTVCAQKSLTTLPNDQSP